MKCISPFDPTLTQECFIVFETIFVLITWMRAYGYCRKTGSISNELNRQFCTLWILKKFGNAVKSLVGDKNCATKCNEKWYSVFKDCGQSNSCGVHFGYWRIYKLIEYQVDFELKGPFWAYFAKFDLTSDFLGGSWETHFLTWIFVYS